MMAPENPSDAKAQDAEPQKEMFGRVLHPPRRPWGPALIITAVIIGAVVLVVGTRKGDPGAVEVVTPVGFRTIRPEMPQGDVVRMIGNPIGTTADGCQQFGYPKMGETTTLTVVCFENGKVREIRTKKVEVNEVQVPGKQEQPPTQQ